MIFFFITNQIMIYLCNSNTFISSFLQSVTNYIIDFRFSNGNLKWFHENLRVSILKNPTDIYRVIVIESKSRRFFGNSQQILPFPLDYITLVWPNIRNQYIYEIKLILENGWGFKIKNQHAFNARKVWWWWRGYA